MDKHLRIMAAEILVESKLSKSAKLQLLNFIKEEASDAQIKALLLDGKVVQLDEQAEQIVNDRFEVSEAGGRVAKLRKSYMSQAGSGGGMSPLWLAYRAARGLFDRCTDKCGKFEINTSRRQHCMARCKVEMIKAKISAAQKQNKSNEVRKLQNQLSKAQKTLNKSTQSFKNRGVDL